MIARPWTDDLPKCKSTSVTSHLSQLGGGNGNSSTSDDYLCLHCQTEDNSSCLYGLFEPHNGIEASRFIMQRMAAELLFPTPPSPTQSQEEIRNRLRNAFLSVEKAYIQNYDGMIAERTSLQYQLQAASDTQRHSILSRLKEIDQHLSGSAAVVLALVLNDKLYVANVGEAKALLCRTDDNSVLRVVQLSADHSLSNEDELLRLSQLGLDVNKLRNTQYLGNQAGTRCLGNYLVKSLYRAFAGLSAAKAEPVIPTPEIHGPIRLDDYSKFLVLVSAGVTKRLQEARGSSDNMNKQIAQKIVEHFSNSTDFSAVSQTILQEIEDEFLTYCFDNNLVPKPKTHMSLLIRNFNFPTVNTNNQNQQNSVQSVNLPASSPVDLGVPSQDMKPGDKDRIKGYVDFSCYYENVAKAKMSGKVLPSFIK